MKKCPYCAEEIQDEAILCRYCNSRLDNESTPNTEPVDESQTDIICPNCGEVNSSSSAFCSECHSILIDNNTSYSLNKDNFPINYDKKQKSILRERDFIDSRKNFTETKRCKSCGETIALDSLFCSYCGKQFYEPKEYNSNSQIHDENTLSNKTSDQSKTDYRKGKSIWISAILIGFLLASLAAIPSLIDLIDIYPQIESGELSSLAIRSWRQDLLFHFLVNFVVWTLVGSIIVRIWRKNKLTLLVMIFLCLLGFYLYDKYSDLLLFGSYASDYIEIREGQWKCVTNLNGDALFEGVIRNSSDQYKIGSIYLNASIYNSSGDLVNSNSGYVDESVIDPRRTSSFEIIVDSQNTKFDKCKIEIIDAQYQK